MDETQTSLEFPIHLIAQTADSLEVILLSNILFTIYIISLASFYQEITTKNQLSY